MWVRRQETNETDSVWQREKQKDKGKIQSQRVALRIVTRGGAAPQRTETGSGHGAAMAYSRFGYFHGVADEKSTWGRRKKLKFWNETMRSREDGQSN